METSVNNSQEPGTLEQAAILLLSIGEDRAADVLRHLPRPELLKVIHAMSNMGGVKVEVVKETLERFFEQFKQQSGVHGASRLFLQRSLDLALGHDIANTVLNSVYGNRIGPKIARLQWVSARWLAEHLAAEHVRVQALFLAFLPPAQASLVVDALPAENRDLLLINIARLDEVNHELLIELEDLIEACLQDLGRQGATVEGVRQAAEIINRMQGDRAQMIELLRAYDPGVVTEIEANMYSFSILAKQTDATLMRVSEVIPMEQWAVALKGADPEVQAALMRALPRRQVQAFEDSLRRSGPMPSARVKQARREIMDRVRELSERGEIELQLFEEEEGA